MMAPANGARTLGILNVQVALNRPGFAGGSTLCEDGALSKQKTAPRYSREVRERAVRMVREHAS